ncbi:MAG: hypothetical protein G3M70_07835 [Candidatus Nitronauta litoralis]|uniref:STI1 domain-containing protein n=1 Tax=Candidatus Nitronauta litoralis TaxID=2705533 RepID=A0A7T0BVN6_9BACT|nr:MAG: hypothetical protein G3M70_07835 [Candidatus Nitronauta litoralis]
MKPKVIILLSLFISASILLAHSAMADAWGPPPTKKTIQSKSKIPSPPSIKKKVVPESENVDELTEKMMDNPESMSKIGKLQNDPTMQKILQDPELMEAIRNKDLSRIASDPKIKALESNQGLQELLKQNQ